MSSAKLTDKQKKDIDIFLEDSVNGIVWSHKLITTKLPYLRKSLSNCLISYCMLNKISIDIEKTVDTFLTEREKK